MEEEDQGNNDDVIFQSINGKGMIILNRPGALNSHTVSMIRRIKVKLKEWRGTHKFIIIKAQGDRAFCSGGDLRGMSDSAKSNGTYHVEVFRQTYLLVDLISHLKIPWISLLQGITMGGGVGMSIYGQFRVATESTLLAMPEVGIGHFPDVGVTHTFPKLMPLALANYLLLTGHRLEGSDNLRIGTATHMCSNSRLDDLERDLLSLDEKGDSRFQSIEQVLQHYTDLCPESKNPFTLQEHMDDIESCFSSDCLQEVLRRLTARNTDWCRETLKTLGKMCPTSLELTKRLLILNAEEGLDLRECLKLEFRAALRCSRNPNYVEGVRAAIVDKDRNQKWIPATLDGVTRNDIDKLLLPSEDELCFDSS